MISISLKFTVSEEHNKETTSELIVITNTSGIDKIIRFIVDNINEIGDGVTIQDLNSTVFINGKFITGPNFTQHYVRRNCNNFSYNYDGNGHVSGIVNNNPYSQYQPSYIHSYNYGSVNDHNQNPIYPINYIVHSNKLSIQLNAGTGNILYDVTSVDNIEVNDI